MAIQVENFSRSVQGTKCCLYDNDQKLVDQGVIRSFFESVPESASYRVVIESQDDKPARTYDLGCLQGEPEEDGVDQFEHYRLVMIFDSM